MTKGDGSRTQAKACLNPECRKPLHNPDRKRYCSSACQNRASYLRIKGAA